MSKLKNILKEKRMTQLELYIIIKEMCYVPLAKYKISKIVSNKGESYTITTLIKLCRALKVSPNELVTNSDFDHLFKK